MELTPLRYFVTVARELHFRRAAAKLNITQAPLSAAIKKLEDELDQKLFERTSRSVKLTAAGEIFLVEAEAVLKRADLARKHLSDMISGKRGNLAVGYNETALNTFLVPLLSEIRSRNPHLRLELREQESGEQIKALHEGTLNIGFMRPYGFDLSGLSSQLVHRENYLLVMPTDHKLARCSKVTGQQLSGESIILFAREVNPDIYDRITVLLSTDELPPPEFRQDARNKSSMLALVRAGFGAALLPESSFHSDDTDLCACSLEAALPPVDIMAVWHPERKTPLLEQMLQSLPTVM